MSAMPSPTTQSGFYAGLLPVEPPVEVPAIRPADVKKDDRLPNERPPFGKRVSRAIARFLITFWIGVGFTLAWQSYGDGAREMITSSYPQLGWLAPQSKPVAQNAPDMIALVAQTGSSFDRQQRLDAISLDLGAVRQSIDQVVANQEQMARTVDQLATGLGRMTYEITKLQAVEQYVLHKSSEPPARPAPAPAHSPVLRPPQAPIAH
jgi:hypothetical protein